MAETFAYLDEPAPETLAPVLRHVAVNAEYRQLTIAAPDAAVLVQPGQFFNLRCPVTVQDEPFLRRPMSVYRADAATGEVEFLYKVAGSGTRALATLRPGDVLSLHGPLGRGFDLRSQWRHIVVVGRGVGLATLAPLAEQAAALQIGITAILSARSPALLMSQSRFEQAGACVVAVTDHDGSSAVDRVEALLRRRHVENRIDALFTCGSQRLLQLLQRLGDELGIPGQVALEQRMACGLGMCYCCVRPMRHEGHIVARRVCWDGPVFPLADVVCEAVP